MRSTLKKSLATSLFALSTSILPAQAVQAEKNVMIVFDGSGSMWGQINGRPKIEIARETLSQVLSETTVNMNLGMIAYGHRQKGQCSDIETVVRSGHSQSTVPAMINAANSIRPKGKTPLSDAVRIAAEELRYTENEATVVLVTDGIETCDADPCALANELESAGINFTTHVVGFGLSRDEGRQVACLAENTGGKYFSADNADGLKDALQETFAALPDEDDFEDAAIPRNVKFIWRDSEGSEQLGIRQLTAELTDSAGNQISNSDFQLTYPEASGNSAIATLEPGDYVVRLTRTGGKAGKGYSFDFAFSVPDGSGEHVIEANLGATLILQPMINPNLRYNKGDPFPTAVAGSRPRFNYRVLAITDGSASPEPVVDLVSDSHAVIPLPPGKYLVQGNIDSGTSVERIVEVAAGKETRFDFSFDATRVFVEKRGNDGALLSKKSANFYDGAPYDVKAWVKGYVTSASKEYPFYLPTGTWGLFVGGSQKMITVTGDYNDLYITINEGDRISDKDRQYLIDRPDSCAEFLKVRYQGCLLQKASLQDASVSNDAPKTETAGNDTIVGDWESALVGLKGVAHTFVDENSEPQVFVVFDKEDVTGKATVIIRQNWCGNGDCEEHSWIEPAKQWKLLLEDSYSAKGINTNSLKLDVSSFGENKEIVISEGQNARVRFTFFDKVYLDEGTKTDSQNQGNPTQTNFSKNGLDASSKRLPVKQELAALSGVFASIGFESNLPPTAMVPLCASKPVLLTENGILSFKRNTNQDFVSEETRYCSQHSSGEIDCYLVPVSGDGKRADISNIDSTAPVLSLRNHDPAKGTVESCLAGPAGRDGPRLCTNLQACTNEVLQTLNPRIFTSIFDAPRNEGK